MLYGKHEVLHGKGDVLWTIQIFHGFDEVFEESPRIKKVTIRTVRDPLSRSKTVKLRSVERDKSADSFVVV